MNMQAGVIIPMNHVGAQYVVKTNAALRITVGATTLVDHVTVGYIKHPKNLKRKQKRNE